MNDAFKDLIKALEALPSPPEPISSTFPVYCPGNGTEGDYFEAEFCDQCKNEDADAEQWCEIHNDALFYDTHEEGYPRDWWVKFNGKPTCLAFRQRDDGDDGDRGGQPVRTPDPDQLDLFLELPILEPA